MAVLCGGLVNVAVNGGPPLAAKPVDGGPLYLVSPWDSSQYRQDIATYTLLIEQYCYVNFRLEARQKKIVGNIYVLNGLILVYNRFYSGLLKHRRMTLQKIFKFV